MIDTFKWRMKWRRWVNRLKKKPADAAGRPAAWPRPLRDLGLFFLALLVVLWIIKPASNQNKNYYTDPEELLRNPRLPPPGRPPAEAGKPAGEGGEGLTVCDDDPFYFGAAAVNYGDTVRYYCPRPADATPVCMRFHKLNSRFPKIVHQMTCPDACSCCLLQYYAQRESSGAVIQYLGYSDGPCEDKEGGSAGGLDELPGDYPSSPSEETFPPPEGGRKGRDLPEGSRSR